MCCLVEIGMMVFGIVTLVKGRFPVSKNRVVTGGPAYLIGAILTGTLPILFAVGLFIGFMAVARTGRQPRIEDYAYLDLIIVPIILLIVTAIALSTAKTTEDTVQQRLERPGGAFVPPTNFPPQDPENPYSSPSAPPE